MHHLNLINILVFAIDLHRELACNATPKMGPMQCLSQDLETGCLKLAVVTFLSVQILKGDHNMLIFQP